ncbi:AEC family transporter [Entomomonas sp. E2T0]|uniref:AEC family transporter n=1 Tax=Entomomonas sp. E2T0 TaxID=2930213 RepID=UPI0022281BD1|nr:AEC family transporter [Entomomonas sp. E2T0]UYZ84621.1 AEC family transporter [Entomomonas sp. E2T0]
MTTLLITLPIFAYIFIGWLAAKSRYVSDKVCEGLSEYVFSIAVPVLIMMTLAQTSSKDPIIPTYWVSYFGACAIAWGITMLLTKKLLKRAHKETVICGYATSQANTVFMGIPLILDVYGQAGSVPLFMLLAIHLPIMLGAASFLIELGGNEKFFTKLKKIVLTICTNPIFIALIIGSFLHYFEIKPEGTIKTILESIAGTASTCALISLGMALNRYRIKDDLKCASIIVVGKLIIHPLAVWVLAFYVFKLPPVYAGVAVLFATLPVGVNAYLLSFYYKTAERPVSSAVLISTVLSVFSVSIWLSLLLKMQ